MNLWLAVDTVAEAASEASSNVQKAENYARTSLDVANSCEKVLTRANTVNQSVRAPNDESSAIVNTLKVYTEEISSVVDVINTISEQTYLR